MKLWRVEVDGDDHGADPDRFVFLVVCRFAFEACSLAQNAFFHELPPQSGVARLCVYESDYPLPATVEALQVATVVAHWREARR